MLRTIQQLLPKFPKEIQAKISSQLTNVKIHHWESGSHLFLESKPFQNLVLMQSGVVRSYYIHDDTEVNLRFLSGVNAVVPFMSVAHAWTDMNQSLISTESIQCLSKVIGYRLPLTFFSEENEFSDKLRAEMALQHYISMEHRLRIVQLKSAKSRYEMFLQLVSPKTIKEIPNYHIASYLNMTPETLSRIKDNF